MASETETPKLRFYLFLTNMNFKTDTQLVIGELEPFGTKEFQVLILTYSV